MCRRYKVYVVCTLFLQFKKNIGQPRCCDFLSEAAAADLKVLAEAAFKRASREENRSRTARSAYYGFFSEMEGGTGNFQVITLTAEAILAASVNTGYTVKNAIEAIRYYGGDVVGIASIFATVGACLDIPVNSVFDPNDLDGYVINPSHECPMCKRGEKVDALINNFAFSKL